ncbi:unnamed protein product [Brachionus calyciflorus]|uniref:PCI domain-containing protein n=1 Tax=Brachionus calyciflorus TaxID=104777 RepID=A0A813YCT4_9BILA|nr:unnamed protein product [Brachionus calyciflorus]
MSVTTNNNNAPSPPQGSNPGASSSNFPYPPPAGSTPAAIAAYQQWYQQYCQYYYAYNNPATAAAMMQAYAQNPTAAATMQGYYNYNQPQAQSQSPATPKQGLLTPPPPPPPPPAQTKPTETKTPTEPPKSQIKINIKFTGDSKNETVAAAAAKTELTPNTQTQEPRKSRFNMTQSVSNVIKEQEKFKEKNNEKITEPLSETSSKIDNVEKKEVSTPGSDIVFDINKWPLSLKTYCAKVYQHYQTITLVSEDQVTKYLQKRITDAFKIKPDLNIPWDREPLPDINSIKQVAPLSQYQIEQQKRQQQLIAQQIELKKKQLLAAQQQQQQKAKIGLMASIKENLKRKKSRSRSRDSTESKSSRTESDHTDNSDNENCISFKKSKSKNYKRKSTDESDDSDGSQGVLDEDKLVESNRKNFKMSNKERRKLAMEQKRKEQEQFIKLSTPKANFGLARKIQSENNLTSLASVRKPLKTIFQLAKEQDIEHDEAMHSKNICVGLCQDLEKEYLRLTGPPEPAVVRPLSVLKKSLDYVLMKYQKTNDYRYICDQMKAIRQDLTVQQIRNEFTIQVYETHARIAIKNKDRDEFNQCQNQLKSLYNIVSSKKITLESYPDNSAEFIGYRLLYNMLTKSYKDIDQVIKEIKQKYSLDNNLKHLLELKQAWYLNNYVKFFKLYKKSNFLCKCLIEQFIERERKQALKAIIKSYRPTIKLQVVSNMLAYESLEECKKDLIEYKINLIEEESSSPNSINANDIYIDFRLMPHLIDKETGLCSVCKRLEIAAIKEGKKYKRQTYDVRKLAIDNLTSKDDPNYKAIIDRHYVKYKDSFDEPIKHRKNVYQSTYTKRLSFDNNLVYEELLGDEEDEDEYELISSRQDHSSRLEVNSRNNNNDYREVLRKVNLAQVSRMNNHSRNSNPYLFQQKSKSSKFIIESPRFRETNSYYELVENTPRIYSKPRIVYQQVEKLPAIDKRRIVYVKNSQNEYTNRDSEYDNYDYSTLQYESLPSLHRDWL